MKYLSVIILLLNICFANAQVIKNADFEIWEHPKPFVYVPKDWSSADLALDGYSTVTQSFDAYTGQSALRLSALQSKSANQKLRSMVCLGKAQIDTTYFNLNYFHAGDSCSFKPLYITGYYKYFPDTTTKDSAYAVAYLSKSETIQPFADAVVSVGYFTFKPTSIYQKFEIKFNHDSFDVSDSIKLVFMYASRNTSINPLGYLLIDNLATEGVLLNVKDVEGLKQSIKIYPNPATNKVFIETKHHLKLNGVKMYDFLGKEVKMQSLLGSELDVSDLKKGIYLLELLTDMGIFSQKLVIN